jgi:hypothetical protein
MAAFSLVGTPPAIGQCRDRQRLPREIACRKWSGTPIAESVRLGLWVTAFTIALRSSSSLRIAPAGFRAVTAFLALPVTGSLVSDGHLIAALVTVSGHGNGRSGGARRV